MSKAVEADDLARLIEADQVARPSRAARYRRYCTRCPSPARASPAARRARRAGARSGRRVGDRADACLHSPRPANLHAARRNKPSRPNIRSERHASAPTLPTGSVSTNARRDRPRGTARSCLGEIDQDRARIEQRSCGVSRQAPADRESVGSLPLGLSARKAGLSGFVRRDVDPVRLAGAAGFLEHDARFHRSGSAPRKAGSGRGARQASA